MTESIESPKISHEPSVFTKVEDVLWIDRRPDEPSLNGTLYITNTHILFAAKDGRELWIPHFQVASVQHIAGDQPLVTVSGKTFFVLNLLIRNVKDCQNVVDSLNELKKAMSIEKLPAFFYVPHLKDLKPADGWNDNDVRADFCRLGLPNDNWVISDFNKNFEYCEGYPEWLFVPRHVPAPVLIGSSKFRSRGRLPVLSYLHSKNEACICRCSQPLAGFSARCIEDESLTRHIAKTNPNSKTLFIVDTRPKINAMVNKAAGKGFEDERNYSSVRYHCFAVENIHAVRGSLQKMLELIGNRKTLSVGQYLTGMMNCGWLKHIHALLEAATFISQNVAAGTSVLVHCSDGWDRTPQTISLACILLDSHYRTMKGFQVLIEREWLLFGHKFSQRCGHICSEDPKEVAPIFTQFLDAVWQLMEQYPTDFEFNEHYLLTLHDHLHSCQFGTFLGNSHKERLELKLSSRTYSLWGFLSRQEEELKNPLYNTGNITEQLIPDLRPHQINLWRTMYNRYDTGCREEILLNTVVAYKQQIESLKFHVAYLNELLAKSVKPYSESRTLSGESCSVDRLPDSAISSASSGEMNVFADKDRKNPHYDVEADTDGYQETVTADLGSTNSAVAVDWCPLMAVSCCSSLQCGTTFWTPEGRHYCWSCGNIFCAKCTGFTAELTGHAKTVRRPVPVCQKCFAKQSNN